jgi:hypothetical protein
LAVFARYSGLIGGSYKNVMEVLIMQYIELQEFEVFMKSRNLVAEKYRSYYIRWVRRFLMSEFSLETMEQRDQVQCFADQLARDDSVAEWQHRQALALEPGDGFPESLQWVVAAFWEALSLFHRSSSLAESFHSWLRPYLQIHRGVPQWLLPLLMLLWNHHTFQRGKREGHSPLELAGVDRVPALSQVLDRVLHPGSFFEPDSQPEIAPPSRLELLFSFEPAQVLI